MVKVYLCTGDLHANKNTPRYRVDDYWGTWQNKMKWIVNTANKNKAIPLIAGDIYDTSRMYADTINIVLEVFSKFERTPYVVAGQHDLLYHTSPEKSPLRTLHIAGMVKWIGESPNIVGVSFGEEIPSAEKDICIIHKCITPKKPPFFLSDAISAKKFLKKNKQFKVVISGDYHVPFTVRTKNGVLINTGTIIRNKKDMEQYVPVVWLLTYDHTNHKVLELTKKVIPHEPYEKVFDIEAIQYEKEHNITMDTSNLVKLMKEDVKELSFKQIVWALYKEDNMGLSKDTIREVL